MIVIFSPSRLKSTAAKLQMSVLTKLMDAQLHSTPSLLPQKKASGRKNKSSLDPVKQIKKIRRIEKKFSTDEKRVRSQQALAAEQARQQQQMENTLPGKKLPIWKRRSNQPEETSASTPSKNAAVPSSSPSKLLPTPSTPTSSKPSSNPTVNSKLVLTPVSGPPPGAKLVPVPNSAVTLPPAKQTPPPPPPPPRQNQLSFDQRVTIKAEPVARAYTRNSGEMEKPRVPRQVREIQQNLNFEKLRKQTLKEAGVSSSSQSASVGGEGELSIDELSEQMAEQRRRLQEEEDYYDNDTGLDYDEVEDDFVGSDTESGSIPSTTLPVAPIKAILKASRTPDIQDPIPKKSVRFSLRPGNVPTPSASSTTSEPEAETTEEPETVVPDDDHIESPPKKNPPVPETNKISDDLDATVDEFHRAIAEEEEEEEQGTSKIEIKLQEATSSFIQTKRPRRQSGDSPPSKKKKTAETPKPGGSIDLPIQSTKRLIASTTTAPEIPMRMEVRKPSTAPPPETPKKLEVPTDQAQIVQEVLKKYPNLVKENKQVKLKIMTKDSAGNSVSQIITIRGGGEDSNLPGGVKSPLPKVCYTGRRGRPKKLKPGEHDPHAKERHQIEQRLKNPTGVDAEYATLDQVGKAHGEGSESEAALIGGEHFQQLDPSSEAEALSNVASGIAASLGLVAVDASGSHDSSMVAGGISQDATATTIIIPAEAGPLSDLENYGTTQTIMVNYEEASEGGVIALQSAPNHGSNPSLDGSSQSQGLHVLQTMPDGVSVLVPAPLTYAQAAATSSSVDSGSDVKYIGNVEDAMEKLHAEETAANCDTEKKELLASSEDGPAQSKKSVSNLAMEWSDDDD